MKSRLFRTVTSFRGGDEGQILGHLAGGDGVQGGLSSLSAKAISSGRLSSSPLAQGAGPGENSGHRVGGGLLAFRCL